MMMMGDLPGSPSVAAEVAPRAHRWNPLGRLDLTTRQAVQVAIAGGLAILLGSGLSTTRYYWAVIAAFVAFAGTSTRSETFIKAGNRVLGTLVGLFAAIWLAELTRGSTALVLVVILASVFLGFYLLRVSYAFMIFFITIMVAQLYSVLNEFSDGLLVLRLEDPRDRVRRCRPVFACSSCRRARATPCGRPAHEPDVLVVRPARRGCPADQPDRGPGRCLRGRQRRWPTARREPGRTGPHCREPAAAAHPRLRTVDPADAAQQRPSPGEP